MDQFHQFSATEALSKLDASPIGLSEEAMLNKRVLYGWNELPEAKHKPMWKVLLKQFGSLLVIVLLLAAVISYSMHHIIDVYVILTVVLINAIIGFVQEIRAEKAISSLKKMLVQHARVLRLGKPQLIPSRELVPGGYPPRHRLPSSALTCSICDH